MPCRGKLSSVQAVETSEPRASLPENRADPVGHTHASHIVQQQSNDICQQDSSNDWRVGKHLQQEA